MYPPSVVLAEKHRPSVPLEEKGALVHFVSGMFADLMGSFIWVPQVRRLFASCPPAQFAVPHSSPDLSSFVRTNCRTW